MGPPLSFRRTTYYWDNILLISYYITYNQNRRSSVIFSAAANRRRKKSRYLLCRSMVPPFFRPTADPTRQSRFDLSTSGTQVSWCLVSQKSSHGVFVSFFKLFVHGFLSFSATGQDFQRKSGKSKSNLLTSQDYNIYKQTHKNMNKNPKNPTPPSRARVRVESHSRASQHTKTKPQRERSQRELLVFFFGFFLEEPRTPPRLMMCNIRPFTSFFFLCFFVVVVFAEMIIRYIIILEMSIYILLY